jgi:hypothetical protein
MRIPIGAGIDLVQAYHLMAFDPHTCMSVGPRDRITQDRAAGHVCTNVHIL